MKRRSAVIVSVLLALVLGTVTVTAAAKVESIKASINYAITTKIFGKSFAPKDDKSKEIRPITYNGRLYVPVTQFANELGYTASFDTKTNKLAIGEKDGKTDLIKGKLFDKYYSGSPTTDPDKLTVNNETYKSGYAVQVTGAFDNKSILFNTKSNYQKISYKASIKLGDEPVRVVFKDEESGLIYKEFSIDSKSGVVSGEVDIGAAKSVRLSVDTRLVSTKTSYSRDNPGEVIIADLFAY